MTSSHGLAARLSEAESTIQALLTGQIDAMVDGKSKSPVLLVAAQAALRESEQRFRAVVELAHDAIMSATSERLVTFWNHSAEKMFGYSAEEMLGKSPQCLLGARFSNGEHPRGLLDYSGGDQVSSDGQVVELDARHKSGREFPVEVALSSWTTNGEVVFMCVVRDISERRRLQADAVRHLQTDGLTGLLVRGVGEQRMAVEVDRARRHTRPLSFGIFDIDHFKQVNDAHGHAGGDSVLASIGSAVREVVRVSDVAVRWGGEELLVAMPETTLDGAIECAERIRCAVTALVHEEAGRVTMSGGVAAYVHGETMAATIGRADAKLYEAKHRGRDRVLG